MCDLHTGTLSKQNSGVDKEGVDLDQGGGGGTVHTDTYGQQDIEIE